MQKLNFYFKYFISFLIGIIGFFLIFNFLFLSAPINFKGENIVTIEEGSSLRSISFQLKEQNIIKSRIVFEAFVISFGGEKRILPGDYLFENKLSVISVAKRITNGERNLAPVKLTIPEGFNIYEIAEVAKLRLVNFDKEKFLIDSQKKEGYLFPDTYFFFTTDNEQDVLNAMSQNFENKIKSVRANILELGKNEKEVIVMASIIEREAKGDSDREIISGILWNRLKIGMPLQVDAAPITYKNKGLPEYPIANPGLKAINAAMHPKASPYIFYIHGKDGNTYFAKTFTEHKQNIQKYLR